MVKTHENSQIVLYSLETIRTTSQIILQIEDTGTNFAGGDKCYYDRKKQVGSLTDELLKVNAENRTLRRKIERLEKAINAK